MKKGIRNIVLQSLPAQTRDRFVKVSLSYDEGGINYFTGSSTVRGYYLCARMVTLLGGAESYAAFSGYRRLLEESKKFSRAKLQRLAELAASSEFLPNLINAALAETGESLA